MEIEEAEDIFLSVLKKIAPNHLEPAIKPIANGNVIDAIKAIRAQSGKGLLESKKIVIELKPINSRVLVELMESTKEKYPEYWL
jgi:ribosomal protein L7/L12